MKIDPLDILLDWLSWVSCPVVLVSWIDISSPLWSQLPPFGVIFLGAIALILLAIPLKQALPPDSPPAVFVYRAIQCGLGVGLAMWRFVA